MAFKEKLDTLLNIEGINLKEFSKLTGISYSAMRAYRKNLYAPSVEQINKMCAVPRFAQYRNLLLSLNEPISEGSAPNSAAIEAQQLLKRLEEVDRLDEATEIMKTLLKRAEKQ